jgi:putative oxidoreductase
MGIIELWKEGAAWGVLCIRIGVGLVFIFHGYPKMTGRWGDCKGSRESVKNSIRRLGLPFPHHLAITVGVIEYFGGMLLILGLGTRFTALLIAEVMLVAGGRNFAEKGFLGGADMPLSLFMTLIGLCLLGGGAFSLDALIGNS